MNGLAKTFCRQQVCGPDRVTVGEFGRGASLLGIPWRLGYSRRTGWLESVVTGSPDLIGRGKWGKWE